MILICNCGSSKTIKISSVLDELGYENMIVPMKNIKNVLHNCFSGLIISGSPILLSENKSSLENFEFIYDYNNPILGICFGHQILGLLYGAEIYKGDLIKRKQTIESIIHNEIFNGLKNKNKFAQNHEEYISLPMDFMEIAYAKNSIGVEAMMHYHKPLYGVQFHPEVSGKPGRKLLENFCQICE